MATTTVSQSIGSSWEAVGTGKSYMTVQLTSGTGVRLVLQDTAEDDPTGSVGIIIDQDSRTAEFSGLATTDKLWARALKTSATIALISADAA